MPFQPILEDPVLPLPIKGKTYVVQSPSAADGLFIQSLMSAARMVEYGAAPFEADSRLVLNDDDERDLHQRALGDVYTQLVDDGVGYHTIKRAGSAAVLWISQGEDAAEAYWNGATHDPKAPAPDPDGSSASEAPPA